MNNLISILLLFLTISVFSQQFEGKSEPLINLNSPYGEDFLSIHPNGKQLLFSRLNHPFNQNGRIDEGDVWVSEFDSVWHAPKNLHSVNDDNFSNPIGFSSDGKTILYNRVSTKGGTLVSEVWAIHNGQKQKLDIKYFNNKSVHQSGCLSSDNRYMIMSLQSGATKGVEDLYVIKREGDQWSAPKNLGSVINTEYQEITPFLSADNQRLYFATNGRKGFGSFDVFVSERLDETWRNWSEPKNLGPQINSSGRETSFVLNHEETRAYFVSTQNSDGYGDIQTIRVLNDSLPVEIPVQVDTTQFVEQVEIPALAGLKLINAKDSKPISAPVDMVILGQVTSKNSDEFGIIPMNGELEGEVEVKGFMGSPFRMYQDSLVEVRLEPLEIGRTIRLENVLFYRGKADIVESSFSQLDEVVQMMNKNPDVRILLKGHTDGNGDPDQNLKLSQERVESAKKYLVKQGVSKRRIEGIGLGGAEPIASNQSEETRRLNRRVEFEVIK